jgi:hypothetical protein
MADEGYEQVKLCAVQGEVAARLLQNALAAEGIPSRTQVSSKDSLGISFPAVYAGGTTTLIEVWVNRARPSDVRGVRGGGA